MRNVLEEIDGDLEDTPEIVSFSVLLTHADN